MKRLQKPPQITSERTRCILLSGIVHDAILDSIPPSAEVNNQGERGNSARERERERSKKKKKTHYI